MIDEAGESYSGLQVTVSYPSYHLRPRTDLRMSLRRGRGRGGQLRILLANWIVS